MTTDRYQRLRATAIFRDDTFSRWQAACVGIIGCGTVGSRIALETVRSGARVRLWDPDRVEEHNLGTQPLRRNLGKVASLMQSCDDINPGAAAGAAVDIRHVGIAELRLCQVLIDATDDPRLAWALTEISNGLQIPLLRCALDGSGRYQLGRVLCSHAAHGGACQLCTYSVDDLLSAVDPTPCPGQGTPERPPTLAGGALADMLSGAAVIQAQRIVTGNESELALDQEVTIDFTHMQIMAARLQRSPRCLSGHLAWELEPIEHRSSDTLGDVAEAITHDLGTQDVTLEAHGHPLCIEAECDCGVTIHRVGTLWADPPECVRCGGRMAWRSETQRAGMHIAQLVELGAMQRTLAELGLPDGVMINARQPGSPTRRYVTAFNAF